MAMICFLKFNKLKVSCPKAILYISIRPNSDNNRTAEKTIQSNFRKWLFNLFNIYSNKNLSKTIKANPNNIPNNCFRVLDNLTSFFNSGIKSEEAI